MFLRSANNYKRGNKSFNNGHMKNNKRKINFNNKRKGEGKNYVLYLSLILTAFIVSVGIFFPDKFNYISTKLFNVLVDKFSPMYLTVMLGIFIFSLYLAFSKYGDIKLGKEND